VWSGGCDAASGVDGDALAAADSRDVDARHLGSRVHGWVENRKRAVQVRLRILIIDAKTVVECELAVHTEVVLDVILEVRVLRLVYSARGLLAIAVDIAEQRVGIAVAGVVQRIIRVLREVIGAGVTAAGGRDLFVALQVEAGL